MSTDGKRPVTRREALRWGGALGAVALGSACAGPTGASAPPPGGPAAIDRRLLDPLPLAVDMVRFDTSHNGEGGRTLPYVEMLESVFASAGVPSEIVPTPKPDNAHLVARVPGAGRARPLLFLCHSDVVSVERERWTTDPFAGTVTDDGWLYGRGALDMKGMNAAVVSALLRHLAEGARFDRDIVFVSDCDEESGSYGTRWLAQQGFERLDAGAVITEGGWLLAGPDGVTPTLAAITVADKPSANVEVVALGTATHSSKPVPDSAILKLDRAQVGLAGYQPPVVLTELTRPYFEALAASASTTDPRLADAVRGMLAAPTQQSLDQAGAAVVASSPFPGLHNAMMRHIVTPVLEDAGYRSNVQPGSARGTVNLRLVPGGTPVADVLGGMRAAAGPDASLEISPELVGGTPPERVDRVQQRVTDRAASPTTTDVYGALSAALTTTYPGVVVTPSLFEAGTSASPWRQRGIPVYGVYPYAVDNETMIRMHGTDERVRVDALRRGADAMYRTLAALRV